MIGIQTCFGNMSKMAGFQRRGPGVLFGYLLQKARFVFHASYLINILFAFSSPGNIRVSLLDFIYLSKKQKYLVSNIHSFKRCSTDGSAVGMYKFAFV